MGMNNYRLHQGSLATQHAFLNLKFNRYFMPSFVKVDGSESRPLSIRVWYNVLIKSEEIIGIVFIFHGLQARIV